MQRIAALDPENTTGKSKELFDAVQNKLGMVPNMMRTMGNSAAVLNGYLSFSGALSESSIGAKLGELIALTVANANGCEYCNAAHSFISDKLVGIDSVSIEDAKEGRSNDEQTQSALTFVRNLVAQKGHIAASDIDDLKNAGYDDTAVVEIIAHTALNIFTNYFNSATSVVVDFPKVELIESAVV